MIFNAYSDTTAGLFGVSVQSGGHIFAQAGRSIRRPNGRDDWLLFYVAKGEERFFLDREIDAKEGSFLLYRPQERQEHLHVDEKTGEFYYVHFCAPEGFDLFGLQSSSVYDGKPSSKVRDLFEEIIGELQGRQLHYEKICAAKLFELLSELARRSAAQTGGYGRYADRIAFAVQILNREYVENRSLEELASICRMSKFHFLRAFREITGSTPIEYRNRIRLEHAKELLADTDMPVGEIGTAVGYSSPVYFCDAFRRQTGISPGRYRQEGRSKQ